MYIPSPRWFQPSNQPSKLVIKNIIFHQGVSEKDVIFETMVDPWLLVLIPRKL
jgi:hypothetical protein